MGASNCDGIGGVRRARSHTRSDDVADARDYSPGQLPASLTSLASLASLMTKIAVRRHPHPAPEE